MISLEFQNDVVLDKPEEYKIVSKIFFSLQKMIFTIRKLSNADRTASCPNSTKQTAASNSKINDLHLHINQINIDFRCSNSITDSFYVVN